jgi:hypothetical protein
VPDGIVEVDNIAGRNSRNVVERKVIVVDLVLLRIDEFPDADIARRGPDRVRDIRGESFMLDFSR